jgi:hypothetical protein
VCNLHTSVRCETCFKYFSVYVGLMGSDTVWIQHFSPKIFYLHTSSHDVGWYVSYDGVSLTSQNCGLRGLLFMPG